MDVTEAEVDVAVAEADETEAEGTQLILDLQLSSVNFKQTES